MSDIEILPLISRWLHVGTAIVILGGTVFIRFVLMPAANRISPEAHEQLRDPLMSIWKRFVHGGIALLLITGFYNYLGVTIKQHRGDGLYNALVGTKLILAFILFFLGSAMVGRSAAFEGMRKKRAMWMGIMVLIGLIIVLISGFVKFLPRTS